MRSVRAVVTNGRVKLYCRRCGQVMRVVGHVRGSGDAGDYCGCAADRKPRPRPAPPTRLVAPLAVTDARRDYPLTITDPVTKNARTAIVRATSLAEAVAMVMR